jgi:UDP-N-acetylmuramate dehydrogenase
MSEVLRGEVHHQEPLSLHTSLRIGGPADVLVVPRDLDDLRLALAIAARERLAVEVIGGGNNLLVKDGGVRGLVVKLDRTFAQLDFREDQAIAGAGMTLSALIRDAAARDLGGIECLVGIPATVGGALAMNAGTADGSIGDFVAAVYLLHPDGTLAEFRPGAGAFTYRAFSFAAGSILIGCRLRLERRPRAEVQREIKQRLKAKKATQPLALASAGCVWKNPPGDAAGRLIEEAGLKGKRIGGAEISPTHANFIVNRADAAAADVLALMDVTRERVHARSGVLLEPEIRIIGEPGSSDSGEDVVFDWDILTMDAGARQLVPAAGQGR